MKPTYRILCIAISLFMPMLSTAQTCYFDNIHQTTPVEQFIDNEDGTILDVKTGLLWMKCSLGQTYSNGDCDGEARLFTSWSEILLETESLNQASASVFSDHVFVLPNIKQLSTIIQRACRAPAINLDLFPSTPSNTYASSTPTHPNYSDQPFRYINFETGLDFTPRIDFFLNARLVALPE